MAAAFSNASYGGCDIEGEFDVYVHVKFLCPKLLDRRTSSAHIFDVVDARYVRIPPGKLDAVIMGTEADIAKNCRHLGVICERIPHHVNHNCAPRSDSWPLRQFEGKYVIGVLGSSNYTYLYKDLADLLPNFEMLTEHGLGLCKFYNRISVALLWTDSASYDELGIRKPPTRLANTARVNVPMVATSAYAAYHQYDPAKHFLCDDLVCVKATIEAMTEGKLRTEFAAVKQRADEDTSWETITGRYQRLFTAAVDRRRNRIE